MDGNIYLGQKKGKSPLRSKINWLSGIMAVLAVLSSKDFGIMFIPEEYLPRILMASSAATFILRNFFSGEPIVWRRQ